MLVKQLQVIVTVKELAEQEWSGPSSMKFFFRCGFVFKVDLTNRVFTSISLFMISILNSSLFAGLDVYRIQNAIGKKKATAKRNEDISYFCCRRTCIYEGIRIDVSSMIQVRWALMSTTSLRFPSFRRKNDKDILKRARIGKC